MAGGSALLAEGAALSGRPALEKVARGAAATGAGVGTVFLVHDLGRPERFLNMLRVFKPTSPMSVGTWILAGYGPAAGIAAASELSPGWLRRTVPGRLLDGLARPAGLSAAALAPAVASYTAVLLSQTAVPAWHSAHEELPFIFTASAAASAGGFGMVVAPTAEAGPARRLALYGAAVELAASQRLERRMGVAAEAFAEGLAGTQLTWASRLTAAGAFGAAFLARRSRTAAVASGAALLAGGFLERLGLLNAGRNSAADPRYTVQPQRERLRGTRRAKA
jgi:formate-dependent nitrite reductase membrane component NrfD